MHLKLELLFIIYPSAIACVNKLINNLLSVCIYSGYFLSFFVIYTPNLKS